MTFQSTCCGSEVKPYGHGYLCVKCQDWTLPKAKEFITEKEMFINLQQGQVLLATCQSCLRLTVDCNFFTQVYTIGLYKDKKLIQQWTMQEWKKAYKIFTRESIENS